MGPRPADGVAMGPARKRGERATGGCEGRRERRRESHLHNGRRCRDAGPPWGEAGARGKEEAGGDGREQNPWEWGETLGAARPQE